MIDPNIEIKINSRKISWCIVTPVEFKADGSVDEYVLSHVFTNTPYRRRGLGKLLLEEAMRQADRANATIYLEAGQEGEGGLTTEQLIKWYESFGFKLFAPRPGTEIHKLLFIENERPGLLRNPMMREPCSTLPNTSKIETSTISSSAPM